MPSLRSKRRLTVVESECGVALDVAVARVPLPPPVKFEAGVRLDGSVASAAADSARRKRDEFPRSAGDVV